MTTGLITIITTIFPLFVFTKALVGNAPPYQVELLGGGAQGCLHHYALTTTDVAALQKADVIVMQGAAMEEGPLAKILLELKQTPKHQVVVASLGLSQLGIAENVAAHAFANPHWAMSEIEYIAKELKNESQVLAVRQKLSPVLQSLADLKSQLERRKIGIAVVHASVKPFVQALSPSSKDLLLGDEESAPTAREIAEAPKLIQRENIALIIVDQHHPAPWIDELAKGTKRKIVAVDPFTEGLLRATLDDYAAAMQGNIERIQRAIAGEGMER